ncbi:MAG: hypothetical protein K9L30_05455 [Desulfobacterales bacterium]|nr:hypothetical protein [Desulfobacterales bacterium]
MSSLNRIYKYLIIIAFLAGFWYVYSNHFVFNFQSSRWQVKPFKKTERTLRYTFISVTSKEPEDLIKIDVLREDGIGDILVDMSVINELEKDRLEKKYSYED